MLRKMQKPQGFNTQPPEGGWVERATRCSTVTGFNTQPPEGGWTAEEIVRQLKAVSTHSRPKAAGELCRRR